MKFGPCGICWMSFAIGLLSALLWAGGGGEGHDECQRHIPQVYAGPTQLVQRCRLLLLWICCDVGFRLGFRFFFMTLTAGVKRGRTTEMRLYSNAR